MNTTMQDESAEQAQKAEEMALIEEILMRAADQIGDVTGPAMELYYRRHPEAEAAFEKHCLGNRPYLEGQMIENSVHCLMNCIESPSQIEILLIESVLHHNDTLQVPPDLYIDLIEATAEVIAKTIPSENTAERAVWTEVRSTLRKVIEDCRKNLAARQTKH